MEEPKSAAGQGLGIAGLVLGILAIPMGIFPCTFYIGILFGIIGIVLSLVALSQANRGAGPKTLIIAALVCSIVGLTFASLWGFTLSRGGAKVIKELMREGEFPHEALEEIGRDAEDVLRDLENDTASAPRSVIMDEMTDSLKALEGEEEQDIE
ncbi:MAG TPA: hypothetical protein VHI78_12615 [Bacteroidales bacterium]|jgi:hypothetical protein|nr:hypothetical protein [Bacteroidales bacterium]